MSVSKFNFPSDPVELASKRAERSMSDSYDITPDDTLLLAELDHGAEQLGFLNNTYFVQAHRAVVLPVSFEATDRLTYVDLMGVTMEGRFATYSKVHIGTIVGAGAVRAVCLAFTDVTLLPYFDKVQDTDLLYIPVLAVTEIASTSQ